MHFQQQHFLLVSRLLSVDRESTLQWEPWYRIENTIHHTCTANATPGKKAHFIADVFSIILQVDEKHLTHSFISNRAQRKTSNLKPAWLNLHDEFWDFSTASRSDTRMIDGVTTESYRSHPRWKTKLQIWDTSHLRWIVGSIVSFEPGILAGKCTSLTPTSCICACFLLRECMMIAINIGTVEENRCQ